MRGRRLAILRRKTWAVVIIVVISLGIVYLAYPQRYVISYPYVHIVPYYRQDTPYYCAEACVQMLLDFYGIEPPSQDILAYEAKFDWCNNITYAREMPHPFLNRGLHVAINLTRNYEWAYENLIQQVKSVPVIVLITWDNGIGHYIVVFWADRAGIEYHDPLYGSNQFSDYDTFKRLWFDNCVSHQPQVVCWALIVWRF